MKIITAVTAMGTLLVILGAMEQAAHADPTQKDDKYGYVFGDDALNAESKGSLTAQIHVRPRGGRDLLLRPRVHFVAEMLKSVENM
jgi:hypothetical protein